MRASKRRMEVRGSATRESGAHQGLIGEAATADGSGQRKAGADNLFLCFARCDSVSCGSNRNLEHDTFASHRVT